MISIYAGWVHRLRGMLVLALATLLLGFGFGLAPAAAQVAPPPVRSSVDENGVDLVGHHFTMSATDLSIGPSSTGLSYARYANGMTYTNNLAGAITGSASSPVVSIGGHSEGFTGGPSYFAANEPTGSTLILDNTTYTYTYTTSDGTVYKFFSNPSVAGLYYSELGYLTSITRPDGLVTTYDNMNLSVQYCYIYGQLPNGQYGCWQYAYQAYTRLSLVHNSAGYTLKLDYASDNIYADPVAWQSLVKVTAINGAYDYCGYGTSCTLTQPWNYVSISTSGSTDTYSDALGNGYTYTYSSGNITGVRRNGHSSDDITIGYNTDGSVHTVTRQGQTWTYAYSSDSSDPNIVTVTDPTSHTRVYRFSSNGRMHSYADETPHTTTYSYNDPSGVASLNTITLPLNDVFTYGYDSRYNVTSVTRTAQSGSGTISTSATYPASCTYLATCNKPTSTTDERNNVTTYSWDNSTGALTQVVRPADSDGNHPTTNYGYSSLYAWYKDSSGALAAASTPIQVLTTVSRCQTNPSCASGSSDEARTTIAYEAGSSSVKSNLLPVSVSRGSGANPSMSAAATAYDIYGNATSVDGPLSGTADTTRTYYNVSRQVTGRVGPAPGGTGSAVATHTTYRSDGQVDHVDSGTVSSPTSDPSTLTVARTVSVGYDSYSRPIRQTLTAGGATYAVSDTSYDTMGRTLCTVQRLNLTSPPTDACTAGTPGSDGPDRINRVAYNADGTVNYVQTGYGVSPRTVATYSYTANGKVATLTDANGNVTTQEYDGFDRAVKVRLPSPTTPGTSSTTDYQELVLDNAGNVTSRHLRGYASDPTHQFINYGYDNLGRVVTKHVGDGSISDTYYHYDLVDRLGYARFGSASGLGITNSYDALDRLLSTVNNMGTTSRTLGYAYDPAGNLTQFTYPDGNYLTYDRDTLGRMTAIHENGGTTAVSASYDSLGRLASQTRGAVTITPGYDAVSRLTSLTHDLSGTASDVTYTYGYTAAGQIKSKTRSNDAYAFAGYANATRSAPVNGLNQLTSSGTHTLGYDARGNLTTDTVSGVTTTYTYDAENHLRGAVGISTLYYDPLGRLWEEVSAGGAANEYVQDGDQIVMSYRGSKQMYYAHDDAGVALLQYAGAGLSSRQSLQTDHQGSPVSIADSTGAMLNINSYDDDYGIYGSGNAGLFGYTGQARLATLGLMYYKARVYSPTLGRFMQTDPIGYGDGPNWYGYVHGDPVNAADPSGLDCVPLPDDPVDHTHGVDCNGSTPSTCYVPGKSCYSYDPHEVGNPILAFNVYALPPCVPGSGGSAVFFSMSCDGFARLLGQIPKLPQPKPRQCMLQLGDSGSVSYIYTNVGASAGGIASHTIGRFVTTKGFSGSFSTTAVGINLGSPGPFVGAGMGTSENLNTFSASNYNIGVNLADFNYTRNYDTGTLNPVGSSFGLETPSAGVSGTYSFTKLSDVRC